MIDAARLRTLFLELVRIDSLSRREGQIAARLAAELRGLGAEVEFDEAGGAVGGEVGNLIAHVPGTAAGEPLLLCAHMDTVEPGTGVVPIVEGDIVRTDGTTVLGGDDKSGLAIVCACVPAASRGSGTRRSRSCSPSAKRWASSGPAISRWTASAPAAGSSSTATRRASSSRARPGRTASRRWCAAARRTRGSRPSRG